MTKEHTPFTKLILRSARFSKVVHQEALVRRALFTKLASALLSREVLRKQLGAPSLLNVLISAEEHFLKVGTLVTKASIKKLTLYLGYY